MYVDRAIEIVMEMESVFFFLHSLYPKYNLAHGCIAFWPIEVQLLLLLLLYELKISGRDIHEIRKYRTEQQYRPRNERLITQSYFYFSEVFSSSCCSRA